MTHKTTQENVKKKTYKMHVKCSVGSKKNLKQKKTDKIG